MAGWLSRIDRRRKKAASAEPAEPPSFEVLCRCGERATGPRIRRYQQVICKHCGEPLFVLPMNVYPEPPPAPKPKPDAPASEAEPDLDAALAEEAARRVRAELALQSHDGDLDPLAALTVESRRSTKKSRKPEPPPAADAPAETPAADTKTPSARSRRRDARQARKAKKQNQAATGTSAEPALTIRIPLRTKARRVVTPFRLTVVLMLVVVLGTTAWQVHKRNVENGRIRFNSARKKAFEQLEQQDYVIAEAHFEEAASAADLIGRHDVIANRIRRLWLETNVINNLSQTSLFEAIDKASQAAETDIAEVLLNEVEDRWIVLDTFVTPVQHPDDGPGFSVEVPLLVNGVLVEARVTGGEFELLDLGEDGDQVIFAAKIDSCTASQGPGGQTVLSIQFEASSVRLWTDPDLLAAIGLAGEEDSDVDEYLSRQAGLFGAHK